VLFPWAVVFKTLGFGAYFAGALFILILFLADFYLWSKGDLEWVRPAPLMAKLEDIVDRLPVRDIVETPTGTATAEPQATIKQP